MAVYSLSDNFKSFFTRLNPSPTFEAQAASEYSSIKTLIEDPHGLAAELAPACFLQGSYRQQTAIYTINDVDIVALCGLSYPGPIGGQSYGRDRIFSIVAAPLVGDARYRGKVYYRASSMCIKIDLGIKVEILPVVYKAGQNDFAKEPFILYRPEKGTWEDGYARYHQQLLSWKNAPGQTNGIFIPAVKVFKHLRSRFKLDAVSFHLECLLFSFPNVLFQGGPADYIAAILSHIAGTAADVWYRYRCDTPCKERDVFTAQEWDLPSWKSFHAAVVVWSRAAAIARQAGDRAVAIRAWQSLLGDDFFPASVSP
jgi:hypothetical protein